MKKASGKMNQLQKAKEACAKNDCDSKCPFYSGECLFYQKPFRWRTDEISKIFESFFDKLIEVQKDLDLEVQKAVHENFDKLL